PSVATHVTAVTVTQGTVVSPTVQLTATARFSDGSSQDVTRSASWATSDASLATVSSTGLVTVHANGEVDVRATFQDVVGSLHLTLSLTKASALTGIVREVAPNVRPLAGVRVQLLAGSWPHTFTDNQGTFALPALSAGRYVIEFSKDGYE